MNSDASLVDGLPRQSPSQPSSNHGPDATINTGPDAAASPGGTPGSKRDMAASQAHLSFRRQRASRACETCHARKVRCDAASLGIPCTNCVAFQIECKIPTPKRKKVPATSTTKDSDR
ncbi:hypothetical protein BD289DRAFT_64156 [Coniella lustricola]|uniref:Zn(2)-C6 fungal-type domain-containing protein n=1 Tax=Coniella lustricola TaxID=2025994 RepID=A0A2T3A096_9PEZI|nr:hypothetical protein BD289DRAFT_64156 [Coniella lustricola]